MDAQTRRERRQARIREGGASRLQKITGSSSPEGAAADYKEHKAPSGNFGKKNYDDPPESEPPALDMMNGDGIPSERANDPLFKMLSQMQEQMGGGAPGGTGANEPGMNQSDPFTSMFNAMMSGQNPMAQEQDAQAAAQQQQSKPVPSKSEAMWMVLHLVSSIVLALHVVNSPHLYATLIWKFCTLQLVLHSSRFLLERGSPPAHSTIAMIAGYLPQPFQNYLIVAARYLQFASLIFKDLTMVLFIIAIHSYLREPQPEVLDKPI
ncbi:hypothetical protein TRICI_005468 [Trichomonascus ciferrii]|uniref:Golgi to ER traffic protein 2 n=1 Tax=Trichomonascus ciferrii TaxID=44093 RepID=A0A642UX61_9ASCO|nr:hypothetical protein TRICI_005468 [Trichomonascus ciferrii]